MAAVETRARRDGSTAYRVFWRDPNDGSRRSMTFDDKGEAERAATLLNANGQHLSLAIDVAKAIRQDGPTVDDVVEEHITLLMRVGDDTRAGYRLRARDHISPHIGQLRVASLTWQQVTRWVQLLQDKGLSTKTIANVHGLLSAAMNTAVRLEYRKDNPCSAIRLPRTQRGGDEMVVLCCSCAALCETVCHVPGGPSSVASTCSVRMVPRLWRDTVDAHRLAVRKAVVDAAGSLVREAGPGAVTMSNLADRAGIGRATIYKYFPDAASVLLAWHSDQLHRHLDRLVEVRNQASDPGQALRLVLASYAGLSSAQPVGELAAALHRGSHAAEAVDELRTFLSDVMLAAVSSGAVRADVPTDELVRYCVHALGAAGDVASPDVLDRLVQLVLTALRPSPREAQTPDQHSRAAGD